MSAPGHTALGAWSGGRYMHFGEPLDDDRFVRLLRPDAAIHTVVTADVYGAGEADLAVGRALAGLPRESFSLVGAIGHDFYGTQRDGSKGFPRGTRLHQAIANAPLSWPELLPVLQTALADHTREDSPPSRLPAKVARELTATCIHIPLYGTRSSTIIAARPGQTLAYLHADGPPCMAPFVDQRALL